MPAESYCLCCHKNMRRDDFRSLFYQSDVICQSCRQKLGYLPVSFRLDDLKVHALYPYGGFARELLLQYKEKNDQALAPAFLYSLRRKLRERYGNYTLVEIPSSALKRAQRGFDHVHDLFALLELPFADKLAKTTERQQKLTSYDKRKLIEKDMVLKDDLLIEGNVLLVDDIVTSGSSLLAGYRLLKKNVNGRIEALCVSYNERFNRIFIDIVKKWRL